MLRSWARWLLSKDTVRAASTSVRDGIGTMWLHRYLLSTGVANLVVDPASIEVNRRAKQAKTDRLDLGKLLFMLIRYHAGEKKVWSVVHVLSPTMEDRRHLHRELTDLKA